VAAYRGVLAAIDGLQGRAFNLGGGPRNAVSLLTLLREIDDITGRATDIAHGDWRQGDQYYFVADTRALHREIGWAPAVGWRAGVRDLAAWLLDNRIGVAAPPA